MPAHLMGVTGMLVQAAWIVCAALAGLDYGSVLHEAPSNQFQHASLISGCAWMAFLALRLMHEKWPAAWETAKPAARLGGDPSEAMNPGARSPNGARAEGRLRRAVRALARLRPLRGDKKLRKGQS